LGTNIKILYQYCTENKNCQAISAFDIANTSILHKILYRVISPGFNDCKMGVLTFGFLMAMALLCTNFLKQVLLQTVE